MFQNGRRRPFCFVLRYIEFSYHMSTPNAPPSGQVLPEVSLAARETLFFNPPNGSFSPLAEIDSEKYLGVILDNKLTFNSHVDSITKKATNLLNLCRRNLYMCTPQIKEAAYNSLVRPHLDYASAAWNSHTSRNINKIEAVQRRAARFVLNNYNYSADAHLTTQIKSQLGWLPLQHRRALYDLSLFYKIRQGLLNINFPTTVKPSVRDPDRYLHIKSIHSEAYLYHFFTRTVRLWNVLPESILAAEGLDTFKAQTAQWIVPLSWTQITGLWTLV